MLYTHLQSLKSSRLSLGTAPFGTTIPRETAFRLLDAYIDAGGNLLDTAAVYGFGVSEQTIGAWMASRGARDRVLISTKGAHPAIPSWEKRITEADIRADMEASLRNLNTSCVDIYFLHRDDEALPVSEIMPVLDRLVREGKTRYIGASNWTVARINAANAFARAEGLTEFSVSQIMWNAACINRDGLYDQTLVAMDGTEYAGYAENRMPVMAYTSQAQGLFSFIQKGGYDSLSDAMKATYLNDTTRRRAEIILSVAAETGISPTALSLAYLLYDHRVEALPILGISKVERLTEAAEAMDLSEEILMTLLS
ncbi:MAG: aldo/keto reductase [Clostridia bacterium]|nr:aldo/keto reductase [Clostridia bacterium]